MMEQQPRRNARALGGARVVERGDHGLAGAGRRDDQVAAAVVDRALDLELVEDLLLKGQGLEANQEPIPLVGRRGLGRQRGGEPRTMQGVVRIVGLELGIRPQGLERAAELVDHVVEVGIADLDHPLVTRAEGGGGANRPVVAAASKSGPAED